MICSVAVPVPCQATPVPGIPPELVAVAVNIVPTALGVAPVAPTRAKFVVPELTTTYFLPITKLPSVTAPVVVATKKSPICGVLIEDHTIGVLFTLVVAVPISVKSVKKSVSPNEDI